MIRPTGKPEARPGSAGARPSHGGLGAISEPPAGTAARLTVIATGPSGSPEELDPLRAAGHEVVIGRPLDMKDRRAYTEAELIEQCRVADVALVSHLERVTPGVLEHAEQLGLVIVPFIGVDKIDVPAATRLGVLVANSPTKENFIAVAEATIGLILMLLKRIKRGEARLRSGDWARREDRGDFLFGKTVGLIGLGRIGTHVARRLANWDVKILAADPYVGRDTADAVGATLVDLPTLLAEADIVSVHAVLTDETRGFIGEKELRRLKPTAIFLNTARGELVDEAAVARAVDERWIAGAAVDAFALEPLPAQHPYRNADPERLILTPHNVGHSEAGRRANLALALEQILAVGRGEPPAHVINPEAIPAWRMKR